MDRQDRAKQFLSFDALKGLREELKKREERHLREENTPNSDNASEENYDVSEEIPYNQSEETPDGDFF